jgi:hypothetical protein
MSYNPATEKCMHYLQAPMSAILNQDEDEVDEIGELFCEEVEEKSRHVNTNTFHRRFVSGSF